MTVDRDRKYHEYRRDLQARYESLGRDHRRYNILLTFGLAMVPLLWVWFWPALVVGGTAIILASVGHYIAMMYRFDYERQRERLSADIAELASEEAAPVAEEVRHADRAPFDTVRAPRRASLGSPFSRR
ncbi:MAG: hypothetical protein ACRELY_13165 [Polyangiaceae bacterium]